MALKLRLESDLKSALKSRRTSDVAALRLILAAMKNEELAKRKELDDSDIIGLLSTLAKQRRESITAFEQGGRADLVEKEKAELELIQTYLPKQLTEKELDKLIDEAIAEAKPESPSDMGKVMKIVMPKTKGRADGKLVSELVRKKLSP